MAALGQGYRQSMVCEREFQTGIDARPCVYGKKIAAGSAHAVPGVVRLVRYAFERGIVGLFIDLRLRRRSLGVLLLLAVMSPAAAHASASAAHASHASGILRLDTGYGQRHHGRCQNDRLHERTLFVPGLPALNLLQTKKRGTEISPARNLMRAKIKDTEKSGNL
jgi:hypothetical protein